MECGLSAHRQREENASPGRRSRRKAGSDAHRVSRTALDCADGWAIRGEVHRGNRPRRQHSPENCRHVLLAVPALNSPQLNRKPGPFLRCFGAEEHEATSARRRLVCSFCCRVCPGLLLHEEVSGASQRVVRILIHRRFLILWRIHQVRRSIVRVEVAVNGMAWQIHAVRITALGTLVAIPARRAALHLAVHFAHRTTIAMPSMG